MNMTEEQVFQATRKVYALYGAFFQSVAQALGLPEALALHEQAHKEQGMASAELIKQKLGDAPLDIQRLGSILQESNLSIGIQCNLAVVSGSSALFRNSRCPLYDGYRMGGLDDETAEALCQKGAAAKLGTMLKQIDPRISYCLKHYRSKRYEPCEEEISYRAEET